MGGLGRDFLLMCLGTFLQGCGAFLLLPVVPLLVDGPLHGGERMVGVAVGAFTGAAMVVRPTCGYLLDRYGRRPWLLGSSALVTLFTAGYLLAHDMTTLLFLRVALGAAWGMAGVAAVTVAADQVPQRLRGLGMGLFGVVLPLALSLGPLLGTWLLGEASYDRVFAAATVLSLLALGIFSTIRVPLVRDPHATLELRSLLELRVIRLFAFMLALCVGYGGWAAFAPLFARQRGLVSAGLLFSVYAVGSLVPRVVGGRWYDRWGPRVPGTTGVAVVLVGWVLLGLVPTAGGAVAGATLLGLGFGTLMPVFNAMAMDLVPARRRGAANATVFLSFDIGSTLGSVGFGLVADARHMEGIFLTASVLTAGALAWFLAAVLPHFHAHRVGDGDDENTTGRLPQPAP